MARGAGRGDYFKYFRQRGAINHSRDGYYSRKYDKASVF